MSGRSAAVRPRVGISRCLLGAPVRYDGGHKLEAGILEALGRDVDWVDVCPEVEIGMGVPREPIHLVASRVSEVRLVGVDSGRDWTDAMAAWAAERIRDLAAMRLSGYVLKARSPSCGPRDVPVAASGGAGVAGLDRGRFADALLGAMPDLPVEDEEQLRSPERRRAFLGRVRAFHARGMQLPIPMECASRIGPPDGPCTRDYVATPIVWQRSHQ